MYTNSRAFLKVDKSTLRPVVIKTDKVNFFVPLDHPAVVGYSLLSPEEKFQASQELLQAQNLDFWSKLPEYNDTQVKNTVQLRNDFQKIPKSDWIRLIKLYAHFCGDSSFAQELEVGALLVIHRETRQLRVVVPEQKVTKASVDWSILGSNIKDEKKLRFLTGEEITYGDLKKDYDNLGITHSHNTMFTSPSGTDDSYEVSHQGKSCPTGVHILVGSFKNFTAYKRKEPTYDVYPSISHLGQRFKIEELSSLVEEYTTEDWLKYDFDEIILGGITQQVYTYQAPAKKYPQIPPRNYSSYSGKNQTDKWALDKRLEGLNYLYESLKNKTHKGANDVLVEQTYKSLEDALDLLYFGLGEDAVVIQEKVVDYFRELGEVDEIDDFPSDEIIEKTIKDYRDPFHYSNY